MKKFFTKIKDLFWGKGKLKGGSPVFIVMIVLSAVALITSNVLAGKSFSIFNWSIGGAPLVLTCGVLVFPVTYILSDLFSEVYGFAASRRATWMGFACNLFFVGFICLGVLIPGANYYYEEIVSNGLVAGLGLDFLKGGSNLGSLGILLASLIAFVIGSWVDDLVFEGIKKATHRDSTGMFIVRAVSSSLAGELIDSIIFIPLLYLFTNAFGSTITNFWQLLAIVGIQAGIKTLYELIVSPFTALLAEKLKRYEHDRFQKEHQAHILMEDPDGEYSDLYLEALEDLSNE